MVGRLLSNFEPYMPDGVYMALVEEPETVGRTTLVLGVWATLNLFATTAVLYLLDEPVAGLTSLIASFLYAVAVPVFLKTGNVVDITRWFLFVSYGVNVGVHVALGGFANSGAYMAWGIIVCTYAVISQTRRFVIGIAALYVVTAAVLVGFESQLASGRAAPEPLVPAFLAANFFIVSVLMLTC